MSWNYKTPPPFAPDAIPTDRGWEAPLAGTDPADELKELVVAIGDLPLKAGAATILSVAFGAASYDEGDALSVTVKFSENVNVADGASIVVASEGTEQYTLYALEQLDAQEIVFDQVVTLDAPVLIDDAELEPFLLSLAAQSVTGTITDADTAEAAATLAVSAGVASAAGTRLVGMVQPEIISLVFNDTPLEPGDALSVTVTFSEDVDVSDGPSIVVASTGDDTSEYTLHAADSTNSFEVTFAVEADLTTPVELSSADTETFVLSLAEQLVDGGTIVSSGTGKLAIRALESEETTEVEVA